MLPVFVAVVFSIGMAVSYRMSAGIHANLEGVNRLQHPFILLITSLHGNLKAIQGDLETAVLINEDISIEQAHEKATEFRSDLKKLGELPGKAETGATIGRYFEEYFPAAEELARRMLTEEVGNLAPEIGRSVAAQRRLDAYLQMQHQGASDTFNEMLSNTLTRMGTILFLNSAIVAFVVVGLSIGSFTIISRITSKLEILYASARRVAEGRYDSVVQAEGDDELGELIRAFNSMQSGLQKSAESQRQYRKDLEALNRGLEEQKEQLRHYALHDTLTGLYNRGAIMERLADEISGARRHGYAITYCMCDVDKFKEINDEYGHQAGDELLSGVGRLISAGGRREDVPGRYGGDEFCIILPHATAAQAKIVVERIRQTIADHEFRDGSGNGFKVTGTFGIAEMNASDETQEDLIRRADDALYAAKEAGRNQVCVAG